MKRLRKYRHPLRHIKSPIKRSMMLTKQSLKTANKKNTVHHPLNKRNPLKKSTVLRKKSIVLQPWIYLFRRHQKSYKLKRCLLKTRLKRKLRKSQQNNLRSKKLHLKKNRRRSKIQRTNSNFVTPVKKFTITMAMTLRKQKLKRVIQ